MHPETLRQYQMAKANKAIPSWVVNTLSGPHHFHVTKALREFAAELLIHGAMSAAQRQALVSAGFAPTATLQ
ncbi:hypothetical protein CDV50_16045 [Haematobacter massiliensis]|nr:hypothetical protein CDV50_16045 [Haematobacter massiliensis]